jgi:hypothetical protein
VIKKNLCFAGLQVSGRSPANNPPVFPGETPYECSSKFSSLTDEVVIASPTLSFPGFSAKGVLHSLPYSRNKTVALSIKSVTRLHTVTGMCATLKRLFEITPRVHFSGDLQGA